MSETNHQVCGCNDLATSTLKVDISVNLGLGFSCGQPGALSLGVGLDLSSQVKSDLWTDAHAIVWSWSTINPAKVYWDPSQGANIDYETLDNSKSDASSAAFSLAAIVAAVAAVAAF